jgi:hypothetical protein
MPAKTHQLPKNMYVPKALVANIIGLTFPITALTAQFNAVVMDALLALTLYFGILVCNVVWHIAFEILLHWIYL